MNLLIGTLEFKKYFNFNFVEFESLKGKDKQIQESRVTSLSLFLTK